MRIGIDCRLAGAQHAGIGRYIEHVVQELIDQHPEAEWVLFFFDRQQADQVLAPLTPAERVGVEVRIVPVKHYSLAEQWSGWQAFQVANLDLLHVPHFNVPVLYRGKLVVTIHDLLWHSQRGTHVTTLSGWKYWLKYLGYQLVSWNAVRKADRILVPSSVIREEVSQLVSSSVDKISITPEGVPKQYAALPIPSEKRLQKAQASKTIVYIGSLYPHKNIEVVLQALKRDSQYKLVVAGARNVFQEDVKARVEALGIGDQVSFLGYQTDEEVLQLLQQALCLVQPSLSEGFGLTGIEAMAAGCPVVASDIPVFQEVYGSAALLFDPHQPDAVLDAVHQLATEPLAVRSQRVAAAKKWANHYSWQATAERTWLEYQHVGA